MADSNPRVVVAAPPAAPGALGAPIDSTVLLRYLEGLQQWHAALRHALDDADQFAHAAKDQAALIPDITLAMALVESVGHSIDRIVAKWDSGRVLRQDTIEISALIWGRLEGAAQTSLSVSFVEACSLCVTMVRSLRERLDESGASLRSRLATATAASDRVRDLAQRCRDKIANAPTLAIPDPGVIGPVPDALGARAQYEQRVGEIERALVVAESTYATPLRERDELRGLLGAYLDMAGDRGNIEQDAIVAAEGDARSVLWMAPCDLVAARDKVAALQHAVRAATRGNQGDRHAV